MRNLTRITAARKQYRKNFEAVGEQVDVVTQDGLGGETTIYGGVWAWQVKLDEADIGHDYAGEVVKFLLLAEDMDALAIRGHPPLDFQDHIIRVNEARWNIIEVDWVRRREAGVTLAYECICEGQGG